MKRLIFILMMVPFISFSQSKLEKDTLFLNDGTKVVKGQNIYFGEGSNASTKGYNYVFINPSFLNPNLINLTAGWSGLKMVVSGFKKVGNKKMGEKYYLLLDAGTVVKYACDIESALTSKEVKLES